MKIQITEADIRCGHRGKSDRCAVALAAKRLHLPEARGKVVYAIPGMGICVRVAGQFQKLWLFPDGVDEFIRKFDLREPVEPAEFELLPVHAR